MLGNFSFFFAVFRGELAHGNEVEFTIFGMKRNTFCAGRRPHVDAKNNDAIQHSSTDATHADNGVVDDDAK